MKAKIKNLLIKLKEWDKKNRSKIYLFVCFWLVFIGVLGLFYSIFLIMNSFHTIDLSLNVLLMVGKEKWWDYVDVYDFEIKGEEINYLSLPYPALYIKAIKQLFFGCFLLFLSTFIFTLGLCGVVCLKIKRR
jgi:NADH:ubiquinone oxidoreductase subunit K